MAQREDLQKLFEAALKQSTPPSRFGIPVEQRKAAPPAAGSADPDVPLPFGATPPPQAAFTPVPSAPAQAPAAFTPVASTPVASAPAAFTPVPEESPAPAPAPDYHATNDELAAIMDEKHIKRKRRHRRQALVTFLLLFGTAGGGTAWFVSNPDRVTALKQTIAEIRSAGDIKAIIAKYQAALDKVAVRGQQIDDATRAMGVDPATAANDADQGFDKEMREMMGEEGGPTAAERNDKLRKSFGSVQETGSLLPGAKAPEKSTDETETTSSP